MEVFMKKLFIITIVIMSLCILLVACGNNTTEAPNDTSNTENTENIENQETETPTCTNHIDVDGDNKCDNCSFSFIEPEEEEDPISENLIKGAEAFNQFLKWNYGIDYTALNRTFVFGEVESNNVELNAAELFPIERIVFYENVAHIVFNTSGIVSNMYLAMDTELMFTVTENKGNYSYDTLEYTNVFYDLLYLKMMLKKFSTMKILLHLMNLKKIYKKMMKTS